jgi:hypothetical protein
MKRPHDGGPCPVPPDTLVKVWYDALNAEAWLCGFAHEWHWSTVVQYEVLIPADEAQAEIAELKRWKNAVLDYCAIHFVEPNMDDPNATLGEVIHTAETQATDPTICGAAQALIERGRQETLQSRRDQFICAALTGVLTDPSVGGDLYSEVPAITVKIADAVMAEADRGRI